MPKPVDITGQRFGRLVAIEPSGSTGREGVAWLCQCDCGALSCVSAKKLRSGNTKSCGCLSAELTRERNYASRTHGHSHSVNGRPTRTFTCWVNMIQRCNNPAHKSWPSYGGRGIKVCDRWLNSFEAFLEDMGECPSRFQIDRVDNDGGYEPGNCRWVTQKVNAGNKRTSRKITFKGVTKGIREWAEELGTSHPALAYRLNNGWSIEEAFTRPFHKGNAWARGSR